MDHSRYQPLPADCPNLYLAGFMGTGKSVVGSRVAHALDLKFLDSDQAIESAEQMSIPDIFERMGEPHFRALERSFVMGGHPTCATVVSCGGGLVTNTELIQHLKNHGVVVVLYAGIETLLKRIASDANRPLMRVEDPRARIESLMAEREEAYRNAGVGIMTDGHTISEVADHVIRIYLEKIKQFQSSPSCSNP